MAWGLYNPSHADKSKVTDTFHKSVPAADFTQIDVETVNGGITVQGYDGGEVDIVTEMTVTGPKQDVCEELIKKIEVKVTGDREILRIEADTPVKFRYSCSVSFEIKAPRSFKAKCESTNGDIEVNELQGGIDASTVNGAVRGNNITGGARVETTNGAIKLRGIQGDTYGEAVNGSIELVFDDGNPQKVHLETVNGRISARYQTVLDAVVSAETINGSLEVAGKEVKKTGWIGKRYNREFGSGRGKYNFETVNGEIQLDFPEGE